jgi:hypothetical protein
LCLTVSACVGLADERVIVAAAGESLRGAVKRRWRRSGVE